jgi:hypothetical protein
MLRLGPGPWVGPEILISLEATQSAFQDPAHEGSREQEKVTPQSGERTDFDTVDCASCAQREQNAERSPAAGLAFDLRKTLRTYPI